MLVLVLVLMLLPIEHVETLNRRGLHLLHATIKWDVGPGLAWPTAIATATTKR